LSRISNPAVVVFVAE